MYAAPSLHRQSGGRLQSNIRSPTISSPVLVGVHIPRFDLAVAAHDHGVAMGSAPLALAPLDGGAGPIGEVSPAAAAAGVRPGMRTGQAHALCPALRLVPPDPLAV